MHTHFFPVGLPDLAALTGDGRWPSLTVVGDGAGRIMRGDQLFRPVASTCFDLEARLDAMDRSGIAIQVLSPVPVTLTTWAEPSLAAAFCSAQNDAFALAISSCGDPERFRWLGAVPFQDPAAAVRELERAVRELGMAGIEIGADGAGRELDDPCFEELWAAIEALDVAVFVHPLDGGAGALRRRGTPYDFGLGMTTDTSMAACALVFGGVLERHPRLRVGLAHGCGTFPWAFPRLARGASLTDARPAPECMAAATELVRRLWADTLVFDPGHLPVLIERFGAEHLFLGSDYPFYPPAFGDPVEMLDVAVKLGSCAHGDAAAIRGPNGLRFVGATP